MVVDEKRRLLNLIEELLDKVYIKDAEQTHRAFSDLHDDIANDFYTAVVLGEFKRGKSTFINALLGENLLPSDILPETATINALIYSEKPQLAVVMNDGSEKLGEVTNDYLKQFSARADQEYINKIKYIKIGYNADILSHNIVIVDTPGVSDINEQRCEVTYRFIPKANVVLFMLDANSPLKKTEKEFIEERLLKAGIDNIIFIVNKYDCVDDEEDEDFLDDLKTKLYRVFCVESENKLEQLRLFPLSAKWALQGIEQHRPELVNASGIRELQTEIEKLVSTGRVEQEKIKRYKLRLYTLLNGLNSAMENKRAMKSADVDSLKKLSADLSEMLEEQMKNKENIRQYVEHEKANMLPIIDKSVHYFYKRIEDNITDQIQFYKGMDFKDFVEQRISKALQRELENWVAGYSPSIDRLLKNMEAEVARGMSYRFQQKVQLAANVSGELQTKNLTFDLSAQDVSNATTQAGLIGAGGAGLMMLIGAPVLLPVISMAAFPFLQRRFLEEKLAQAKDQIIPEVQEQLARAVSRLKSQIHKYVDDRCEVIIKNSEAAYEAILLNMQKDINEQINAKECAGNDLSAEMQAISRNIAEVQAVMKQIC